MQNFLANDWDKTNSQKRGGGRKLLSLDVETGESKLRVELGHDLTAERIFDRVWAVQLLELVVARLRDEFEAKGKSAEFEVLQTFLSGKKGNDSHDQAAAQLGLSPDATRQAAHRMRKRYRELLRAEVAQTVAGEDEIDDEIRGLFAALGG